MSTDIGNLSYTPFEPVATDAKLYALAITGDVSAYEFTNWRDETTSWKKTCYLHAGLNPTDTVKFKGPDLIKFFSRVCVNDFGNFSVGRIKHGIMCTEDGLILQDGVLVRSGEDEITSYWMVPGLNYALASGKYGKFDVECETLTGKFFLYQVGGPVSINVLEDVCGQSLRELRFLRTMDAVIAGKPVKIFRIGMAGTLAYEVHGAVEDAHAVYDAIYEAGLPFGMRRLGSHCYPMNHAENGYPQWGVHFPYAPDKGMSEYVARTPGLERFSMMEMMMVSGSLSDDRSAYFHNPFEFGWGKMVKFNHDFVGKAALERIAAENMRQLVTLEWNVEDIADVYASQFRDEQPYKYIESPSALDFWIGGTSVSHDRVVNGKGEMIGTSFGRQNSAYFHRMISICCIDTAYAELGTEVMVVWGEPGTRQKHIRATVARYPYNNVLRNETTDVATLPETASLKNRGTVASVEGRYNITVHSPMGNMDGSFEYIVDGSTLTGTATAMESTVEIYDGTVDGNNFSHKMEMKTPMGKMKATVSGKVDGDSISGVFKMMMMGKMAFKGVRA